MHSIHFNIICGNHMDLCDTGHAFNQAKFTPKGVAYVAGLWNKSGESK